MTKFPDAWLLPLFPLLFRLVYCLVVNILKFMSKNIITPLSSANSRKSMIYSVRRLCFYFMLMNFRGWVLYIFLNKVEDQFVVRSYSTSNTCWYNREGWFPHSSEQEVCAGRPFDFSDHVVLYYAQILPIALFETLYIIIEHPNWYTVMATRQTQRNLNHFLRWLIPTALMGTHLYLQIITTFGAYKTTLYFHTPFEIVAGFIISMIVSVPLCRIQCSNSNLGLLFYVRSFLFEH